MPAPDPVPTLIHGLMEAIMASLRSAAESKGLRLELAQDPEDIVVRVDRKLLGRAVIDLLHASIEHLAGGMVRVSISRGIDASRGMIEISVARIGESDGTSLATPGSSQEAARMLGGRVVRIDDRGGSANVLQFPSR